MLKHAAVLILGFGLSSCSDETPDIGQRWTDGTLPANTPVKPRWYDSEDVQLGAAIFRENCATCHGASAEGTPDWRKRDAEGRLPPPPLNGTAHAWHHPRDVLQRVIREGGQAYGGSMPGFADRLSGTQIEQVIAWVQSNWSDGIYQQWQEIDTQAGILK